MNHRVAEFDKWLQVFEQHASMRQAAGFSNVHVWQGAGEPNNVFIYMEGDDLAKMQAFGQSEELKQAMQRAGVASAPQINLLENERKYQY
jgi:heme-degrading monooxygenase HmoA